MTRLLLVWMTVLVGCAAPVHTARLDAMAATSPREAEAQARWEDKHCAPALGLLWPGVGQACLGKPAEASVLAVGTVAEVGAGVALLMTEDTPEDPPLSTLTPWVGVQNLWVYGITDVALSRRRAAQLRYVPVDTLGELVAAPFNPRVLERPAVWAGTLGLLGGATALTLLTEPAAPGSPTLFGERLHPALGWAGTFGLGTLLFEHVAIGEEIAFRGLLQSDLARSLGETPGWLAGSAVFGGTHALNALLLAPEDRASYLLVAVPWITLAGAWLGHAYRTEGYSLAAPVAIHFWYDLLVTAVSVARDPSSGIFAMRFGGRL